MVQHETRVNRGQRKSLQDHPGNKKSATSLYKQTAGISTIVFSYPNSSQLSSTGWYITSSKAFLQGAITNSIALVRTSCRARLRGTHRWSRRTLLGICRKLPRSSAPLGPMPREASGTRGSEWRVGTHHWVPGMDRFAQDL